MASERRVISAMRFGYGLTASGAGGAERPGDLIGDVLEAAPPPPRSTAGHGALIDALRAAQRRSRAEPGDAATEALRRARRRVNRQAREDVRTRLIRAVGTEAGLTERLVAFWADHFTVEAKTPALALMAADMVETAIRPHVQGSFPAMLRAVLQHPAMLIYLDQRSSVGPGSRFGRRRGRGLNENLAREVLELHTLGVDAGYTQVDVRQLAELLTGMTVNADGFQFRPGIAEPGAETILGRQYGGPEARLEPVLAAIDDLARHPETAAHLARKLATHFVGPAAEPDLLVHLTARFAETGGDLGAVTAGLVEHPAAWRPLGAKVRTPFEFVAAALRATGLGAEALAGLDHPALRRGLLAPLAAMGQPPGRPGGPDGWPEAAEAWITPATLTARLEWAKGLAARLAGRIDPRALPDRVLGPLAGSDLRFAVAAAETREEGLALFLAAPAFQRR